MLEQQLLEEFSVRLRAEIAEKLAELAPETVLAGETALADVMLGYMEEAGLVTEHELCPYEDTAGRNRCRVVGYALPEVELSHFPELKAWLREKDVATKKVYGDGNHLCSMSFVPGPKPFPCPVVALLRRKTAVTAPYAVFFVAFANWTYQIFVPSFR